MVPGILGEANGVALRIPETVDAKFRPETVVTQVGGKGRKRLIVHTADVFAYIQRNYTENISLNKLATFAFVSPKYFSRLFKTHTGCTVSDYTQKLRVRHACSMLANSNISVSEIAVQLGYSDVKYFSAVFRRLMGISPTEYCRRNRQENV